MPAQRPAKRVWNSYQTTLVSDSGYRFLGRQSPSDFLAQKEPHYFAHNRQDLLSNDYFEWGNFSQPQGAGNGVVVRHGYAVYTLLEAALDDSLQWRETICRIAGMDM